jgi:hypothetical protein
MEEQLKSGTPGPTPPTAWEWESADCPITVVLSYDVVDRLGYDVMRGFGLVPRRGAEVGGILLGKIESGPRTRILIEDYVPVACLYERGPSYLLSEAEADKFAELVIRWRSESGRSLLAVGYYRSNTREQFSLGPEDLHLLEKWFPAPSAICLLIRPYATKVSEAAFFLREAHDFTEGAAPPMIPFRRKELGGGSPARRPRAAALAAESAAMDIQTPPVVRTETPAATAESSPELQEIAAPPEESVAAPKRALASSSPSWVWIPLSLIFLLLGLVLGFQIALSFTERQAQKDPYLLSLSTSRFGDSMYLKWNADSAPVRKSQRGILHILDGDNRKTFELSQEDLARGGALYQNTSSTVKFRLEVFTSDRVSVSEALESSVVSGSGGNGSLQ